MNEEAEKRIIANTQSSAQFSDYYDRRWEALCDNEWPGSEGYGLVRVRFIDEVVTEFVSRTDLEILDLGCGTGWLSKALSRYGTVTGIDFAPQTIAKAQHEYGDHGHFMVADPASPTMGLSNTFDLVVASEVIEHVEDHAAFATLIASLLRPNGWLILTTPNLRLKHYVMADARKRKYWQPIENWLAPTQLTNLLRHHGFIIRRHEGFTTSKNFGYTPIQRAAGHWLVRRAAERLGLRRQYGRLILPLAMYQLVIAQKRNV